MSHLDRLSALMAHFALQVEPAPPDQAQLYVVQGQGAPVILLTPNAPGQCHARPGEDLVFAARVSWGGAQSPVLAALPTCIRHDTGADPGDDPGMASLVDLICTEYRAQRCGAGTVLNRLAEVLFVRLLRAEIQKGAIGTGLLAGLADPRLARALVAIHGAPGQDWTNAAMAGAAGLSLSRFVELFRARLGQSPQAYLRQWRLSLARRDIERGDRIDAIARRYGYGSPEALTHAFRRATGLAPTALRRA